MPRRLLLLIAAGLVASLLVLHLTTGAEVTASHELEELLSDAWEYRLAEDPLLATDVGDHRFDDQLPEMAPADHLRRRERWAEFLERLEGIRRDALTPEERIDAAIFERLSADRIAEIDHGAHLMPLTAGTGFHTEFPQLPERMRLSSVGDHEAYIARLEAFERYTRQHIALMRRGIEEGRVLPRVVLEGYEVQIEPHIVDDPEDSLLYLPFEELPGSMETATAERLAAAARQAIAGSVVPAYREFGRFMAEEYLPATRSPVGASALPGGEAFYAHRVRRFTTLELTPREVHETGLAEVARIRAEMEAVLEEVGFEGSFREFVEFLRTEERFYAESPEELLRRTSLVLKRMDGKLPELFATLPRTPYGIKKVPDYIAPKTYTAYYEPPAGDGTRAGYYAVNTYNLPSRPLYEIEALSFHEAVPGHHLQIALQQEIEDLHPFRRFERFTAFVEGWALYSERLGLEVGFYEDPYSNFGRLTYEMWRALRLVVDTGIHAFGWSRQRAIDYMADNSALSLHNITTEVDRYISWPGQALAYKTGELHIRRLRERAEKALGSGFDVRHFHDVVLGSGAVPLSVLEAKVERWIDERSATSTP